MREIQVAILGLGTVGTGVYKVLKSASEDIQKKTGCQITVKKVLVRNMEKAAKKVEDASILTNNWSEIVNDPEIQIVIEVMGGLHPAKECILDALNAGKNVVTANKDLIAEDGRILLETADKNGKDFLFEAAVAGGIPIIRPMRQCLAGNHIDTVMGIVNGTTNFILSKMVQEGMDFDEALALATELGYAESDPTADVEGLDAGRKVAIMASIAFNSRVTFADVYTEGITKITARDIRYATELNQVIKLLGVAKNTESGIEASVYPMLISKNHPLASVNDSFNAVFLHGDAVDDAMFYGRGAGELPTASAVVGDVIDVARNIICECTGRIGCGCYKNIPIKKIGDVKNKFFIRMQVENKCGVLAAVAKILGEHNVSIDTFIQKECYKGMAEIVLTTEDVYEKDFYAAVELCKDLEVVKEISSIIRVY